jgi:signal peptidase II
MKKLWLLLAVPIIALDQWVKAWAVINIASRSYMPAYPDFFIVKLTYAENTGAAFSLLGGGGARWFLVAVSSIAAAAIVLAVCRKWVDGTVAVAALGCVLGGALGNLIDRVRLGYVVDMFEFTFMRFAIFNVADVFITTGGACFVLVMLMGEMKRKKHAAMD